jgi:hypothetical protein
VAPRGDGRKIRPVALALSALVALGTLSSCADDEGARSRPSTSATTTTNETTTTGVGDDHEVLDAYVAFWNDGYLEAADPMDPTNPALAAHATGDQLETLERAFLARQASGEVIRGTLDLDPRIVSVVGETATVRDCYLDNTGIYDAATGERRDTASGVRHLITATLVVEDESWKVSDLAQEGDGCTTA